MMSVRKLYSLGFLLLLASATLLQSCTDPPEYPIEPHIEFNSYSTNKIDYDTIPLNISGQLDTVFLKMNFTDGDGDIGYANPDTADCDICSWDGPTSCIYHPSRDLYLFDLRDSCLTAYNMPVVESTNSNGSVSGVVNLDVFSICCKRYVTTPCSKSPAPAVDTLQYQVMIRDRAMHYSNRISLPPIFIHCDW